MQTQPFRRVLRKRCSENMQQICRRTPMPKCDFNSICVRALLNHTSRWVFFCKFAAYSQNTFSLEHLWRTASDFYTLKIKRKRLLNQFMVLYFDKQDSVSKNNTEIQDVLKISINKWKSINTLLQKCISFPKQFFLTLPLVVEGIKFNKIEFKFCMDLIIFSHLM